jgi:hypothetical protein
LGYWGTKRVGKSTREHGRELCIRTQTSVNFNV